MSADVAPRPDVAAISSLLRNRLTALFDRAPDVRVGLVVAPAGSGKSTLVAQLAHLHDGPVVWCDITDPVPRTAEALAAGLLACLPAGTRHPGDGRGIDAVLAAVARGGPLLLVIDDAHVVDGSGAEAALSALANRIPAPARLLLASRVNLDLDLSRARVAGHLVEVGADDLRFRTWEVEQLFDSVYRDRLGPEDIAVLTRRTAGWAAYLQLFHLAIARKTPVQRRQMLRGLNNPARLVREYLASQVLAGLDGEMRDFLVRTSVLRRPTGRLCDELLGRRGSEAALAELERRQVFTERVDVDDSYRYHSVMLGVLDAYLIEAVGLTEARAAHLRAAGLLERAGYLEEAVIASAKGEDWPGVARLLELLGVGGDQALNESLLDLLPAPSLENDPWLLMLKAGRSLRRGSLRRAVEGLTAAEAAASGSLAERCRALRIRVTAWLFSDPVTGPDWTALLRSATQRRPGEVTHLPGATGHLVDAVAALLAGDIRRSRRSAAVLAGHPDADALLWSGAQLLLAIGDLVSGGDGHPLDDPGLLESVEAADVPWLTRLLRAVQAAGTGDLAATDELRRACRADEDTWGEALVAAIGAGGALAAGDGRGAAASLVEAAAAFGVLGAGVLETWAQALAAVAWWQGGEAERAVAAAHQARTLAGLREVPGASGLAAAVLGLAGGDDRQLAWAEGVLRPLGLWDRLVHPVPAQATVHPSPRSAGPLTVAAAQPDVAPGTVVRCLGRFALVVDGHAVDESTAKPMERAALHVLALRAGEPVHREELGELLWPGAKPDAARHRLQVAVSALRRLLAVSGADGAGHLVRKGDAYALVVPPDADVDLWRLRRAAARAGSARANGDTAAESDALEDILSTYRGPLLPGDGPAEWVVGARAAAQDTASSAAVRLATLRLDTGELDGAADAARAGLVVDRYRDDLWRVAMSIAERAGHHAEATQLRQGYDAMLTEIGLDPGAD